MSITFPFKMLSWLRNLMSWPQSLGLPKTKGKVPSDGHPKRQNDGEPARKETTSQSRGTS